LAKKTRIQGVVKLHALISKGGTIEDLKVVSGHPLLVPSALEAVKQWVYRPTLLDGETVGVETEIEVNFILSP
jgi:protein TonB